ncbi:MAG: ABC transporter permease [Bacteroidetes bacterium]|nr:ABC transporter permease [Bacteroidota bacterium]
MRDKAGLVILFLMPMVLIVIMSLLQEVGYNSIRRESQVDVLFLDRDCDSLGIKIRNGLASSGFFNLIDSLERKPVTEASIRNAVRKGDFVIGIVIPRGVTKKIRNNVRIMVAKTMSGFGLYNHSIFGDMPLSTADTVTIFFDPTVKKSFKNSIVSAVKQYNYRIESEMVFSTFNHEMAKVFPTYHPPDLSYKDAVEFKEVFPTFRENEAIPDTAQHNVPAWAVFAMFFIIIPLTSSMIVEREEGSMFRLIAMPVSYIQLLMAKVFVYMLVCFVQTILMILAGLYILPMFGAPALILGDHILALIVITIFTALAALGFGVMVGTVANTHQQAAAFGAVSIIIMAALGGLWVPMYLMAPVMQHVSSLSPLNWALNGYYDILVRDGGFLEILPKIIKLALFFISTILITSIYWKFNNPMNK